MFKELLETNPLISMITKSDGTVQLDFVHESDYGAVNVLSIPLIKVLDERAEAFGVAKLKKLTVFVLWLDI